MTDDRFLESMRREPRPEFARDLRDRLRAAEDAPAPRWRPAVMAGVAIAVVALAFLMPQVRASAQAVLDLFRVRQFTAIPYDEGRFEKVRQLQKDQDMLLVFDDKEILRDPGPPKEYPDLDQAGAAAGLTLRKPAEIPGEMKLERIMVQGEEERRFTLHTAKLRPVLDALDLRDVEIPAGFDGQPITVHKPPVVMQRFASPRRHVVLIQARSPEVTLPPGADLERLGEVGLRALGLDAGEARSIARSIDWHNTLLIPVPTSAASFRKVTVRGRPGLLVVTMEKADSTGSHRRQGSVLLWSEDDRVLGLVGNLTAEDLMQMAESVQ